MELKRGGRARVQKEMVEFISSPLPFSSKLIVVVLERQRKHDVMKRERKRERVVDERTTDVPS